MKRFLILAVFVGVLSSFCTRDGYPCHSFDTGVCTHRLHSYDYDAYGYTYPCGHATHAYDVYPCGHVCY